MVRDLTVGKYTFQPGAEYAALTVQGAVARDDVQSERQVTEPLLREFLVLLEEVQEDLNSRWNGRENSGRRGQSDGSHFRES
ncbi:hypothetical protein OHT68_19470 [Streptomyces canus]|uniref:hypothetical protein n=1 Tax=Streptomyces canus TaxID=58343 RepID=UPI002E2E2FA0|nr:hypothetical protein [Streptomyces canus]